jgi:hypothetical protein
MLHRAEQAWLAEGGAKATDARLSLRGCMQQQITATHSGRCASAAVQTRMGPGRTFPWTAL